MGPLTSWNSLQMQYVTGKLQYFIMVKFIMIHNLTGVKFNALEKYSNHTTTKNHNVYFVVFNTIWKIQQKQKATPNQGHGGLMTFWLIKTLLFIYSSEKNSEWVTCKCRKSVRNFWLAVYVIVFFDKRSFITQETYRMPTKDQCSRPET